MACLENVFEKEGSEHIILMHLQNSNRCFVMKNDKLLMVAILSIHVVNRR